MTKLYKVLGRNGEPINGGYGKWSLPRGGKPGKWMPSIEGEIIACKNGYHLCERKDILRWSSTQEILIYEAVGRGDCDKRDDKIAFRQAQLKRKIGSLNPKTLRLFAADCAEHVLHLFEEQHPMDNRPRKAIQATRDYAIGKIDDAARAAALADAWDAAGAAAVAAAWADARDAAWTTESEWQERRLWEYITGRRK